MTSAERLAREFHETYERMAPRFKYETRKDSAVPWEDVPEPNKSLMLAVAAHLTKAGWVRVEDVEKIVTDQIAYYPRQWALGGVLLDICALTTDND